jgi:hypothetical protein
MFVPMLPVTLLAHKCPAELPSGMRFMDSSPWIWLCIGLNYIDMKGD